MFRNTVKTVYFTHVSMPVTKYRLMLLCDVQRKNTEQMLSIVTEYLWTSVNKKVYSSVAL